MSQVPGLGHVTSCFYSTLFHLNKGVGVTRDRKLKLEDTKVSHILGGTGEGEGPEDNEEDRRYLRRGKGIGVIKLIRQLVFGPNHVIRGKSRDYRD